MRFAASVPTDQQLQEIGQLPERPLMRKHPPLIDHKPHSPNFFTALYTYNHTHYHTE
jgi:hypothetical protein